MTQTTPPSSGYRWNATPFAEGYDQAAEVIHPRYLEIQSVIASFLPPLVAGDLVVDLGGGSGRLVERILDQFPKTSAIVLDQSEPFLALAERRLARFGQRATCLLARLQDRWSTQLPARAAAIVSMSAIHHLEPAEKQSLYRQCFEALAPGGLLLNGDEVRAAADDAYRAELWAWAGHMRAAMAGGTVPESFHPALEKWIDRNVVRFGEPKVSGDDCHETINAQLGYFRAAGFAFADCPWQQALWAVLRGQKAS
ncbi:MAG TPA: class I SAM-dependent methyltransferase [Pirellulaceae bacterium]|nr:class I SAM-dependent methyltransferase [Pirellulaceae bacterium]